MESGGEHQHKLCGFLRAVLSVPGPPLPPGAPCSLFRDGATVGLRSQDGLLLLPLGDAAANALPNPENEDDGTAGAHPSSSSSSSAPPPLRRRRRGMGLVNGSMSVVHQLHALTTHRCLKIEARVMRISARGEEGMRAVVLVDVYLPIAVWSGWQFPKSRVLAAALFKHVSCDWEARGTYLAFEQNAGCYSHPEDERIWKNSDCHVLGCSTHSSSSSSGAKKLFNLHELFKSLPSIGKDVKVLSTKIKPEDASFSRGIWDVTDDLLIHVLCALGPKDLVRVAATCRHLRSLAVSVTPCMKLKLFPHQEAAVEWMLKRECSSQVLAHPLYMDFSTDDGFSFFINSVSGEISSGMAPTYNDFRGGMFCDEPGLGKTVTALSLILKTYGTLAEPPHGVDVVWCQGNPDHKCGYYELSADNFTPGNFMSTWKRFVDQNARRGKFCSTKKSESSCVEMSISSSRKRGRSCGAEQFIKSAAPSCEKSIFSPSARARSIPVVSVRRCTRNLSHVKRNLLNTFDADSGASNKRMAAGSANREAQIINAPKVKPVLEQDDMSLRMLGSSNKSTTANVGIDSSETWVQCDACKKWRKLSDWIEPDAEAAWFCSMNTNPLYQSCAAPEESWNYKQKITYLPGFFTKGTPQGKEENVSFFTSVLKEHYQLLDSVTKKALTWLANLSQKDLLEMETIGLVRSSEALFLEENSLAYYKIFRAFGLVRKVVRRVSRWYYPSNLVDLALDLSALRTALTKPLDLFRLYLSRATLIVVPANLVDHWKTQIQKHVSAGQLRMYVWTDHQKPTAHNLAWDYDIVITTFNRLSAEWGSRKRSILMQVHWLRVMLDEGHTLGSSVSLTNKLQMAISLAASSRWILTGTPTPNTPNSQAAHLHCMLKFLHEEVYGRNQNSWEAGILKPFEAQMEEGRSRLLELLRRIMISARKVDLKNIPPCIKKVTYLRFTEEHANSYNELVVNVRRNILLADWNDPSHVESLLNPKQWKFRGNTIRNVRLSCCVAGHIKLKDAGQDIKETMDILVQQGLDPLSEEYIFIKNSLMDGCSCFRCKDWCRLPMITPCRHLLCLDCVALDRERCTFPGCGNLYEMQSPEVLRRPENPNPKWPVPKDLIELQPSYNQDDWNPDWHATSSSKVSYLIERLKEIQKSSGKVVHSFDITDDGKLLMFAQKCHYDVLTAGDITTKLNNDSCKTLPEKVIIFSQFLEHINVIEQQLTLAGIKYAAIYSPMHSCNKVRSLMVFQHDASCMVLLMDGSSALGLDLSFVGHVFLMEPIWDRSMEEQVISRAHRMGATRPIHVETLAMSGTIEEQMLGFLQDADACSRTVKQEISNTDQQGLRTYRTLHDFAESSYLAQLSFVKTNVKT